ncbi:MAG: peptide deformylase [Parasphingopyxis sp.]|uniref:peptide deformylase n=1 Tax=Parasphingopyxis sp. TaxID=1920299 RepID=UPI0032EBF0EB
MAILSILEAPDPRLRTVSEPIDEVTDETRTLIADMFETMYDAPGIGLAAIQVGVPKRILVIDLQEPAPHDHDHAHGEHCDHEHEVIKDPRVFINPEILETATEMRAYEEGCLSVPDQFADVDRPDWCVARWMDENGNQFEERLEGMIATCLQHEMDHLEGILFIDHLSRMKRTMLMKKLEKARRLQAA